MVDQKLELYSAEKMFPRNLQEQMDFWSIQAYMLSIKLEPEEELLDSGDSDDFDPLPHQMAV